MELNSLLTLLAILAFGASNIYVQWRMGGNSASQIVINAYKEQVALQDKKISELTHTVGSLQGQLQEKDKRITLLQELASGNTPEMSLFMKSMLTYTVNSKTYMETSTKTMVKVEKCLEGIQKEMVLLRKMKA